MLALDEFEEAVLIEADFFNWSVGNLVNDIQSRDKSMGLVKACQVACRVIGSLFAQGAIKVTKTEYIQEDEDLFTPIRETDMTREDLNAFLTTPEQWEALGVFSERLPYEIGITEKGREMLCRIRGMDSFSA